MNEVNHKYRLRYRKGDYELELEGDKEWIEKVFEEFMKSEKIEPEFAESIITRGKTVYERT